MNSYVVQTHVSVKQAVEHLYSHASFSKKIHLLQGLTQVEEMLISAVLPITSLYRLPHGEDSDFTGVHSEHRPECMHTLSLWIHNNIMSCISENIYMYHLTSATARLRSGSPHNVLHFTSIDLHRVTDCFRRIRG